MTKLEKLEEAFKIKKEYVSFLIRQLKDYPEGSNSFKIAACKLHKEQARLATAKAKYEYEQTRVALKNRANYKKTLAR